MDEKILRLREKVTGGLNKMIFMTFEDAYLYSSKMTAFSHVSKRDIKSGILSAIKNGNEFPKKSGYTWDILLTPENILD